MQPFERLTSRTPVALPHRNGTGNAQQCASLLLETMPRVLKAMRVGLGAVRTGVSSVTVPQYRTLLFVRQHEGASLSELAEFMGLTLPSASKLVDHLVKRAILVRQADSVDRRRMTLRISRKGDALFNNAQGRVRQHLAGMLIGWDTDALKVLVRALGILQESFPPLGGDSPKPRGSPATGPRKSVFRSASAS